MSGPTLAVVAIASAALSGYAAIQGAKAQKKMLANLFRGHHHSAPDGPQRLKGLETFQTRIDTPKPLKHGFEYNRYQISTGEFSIDR